MSSSTDVGTATRWLRAAGAVALVAVQLAGLWAYRGAAGREAALASPEMTTLLRWRPDATGVVEFHGDQAFALSGERGLEMVRLGSDTIVLAGGTPAAPSVLRPGIAVSVWGDAAGPRETAARVVLAWVPER